MSASAQTAIWNAKIGNRAKKDVLICMADHADHLGEHIHPSVGLIAWKMEITERQVRRIIRELEEDGFLVRMSDGLGGRKRTTEYRIDFDRLPIRPPYRSQKADIAMSGYEREKADIAMSGYQNADISETRTFSTRNPDIFDRNPDIAMSAEPYNHIEPLDTALARAASDVPLAGDVEAENDEEVLQPKPFEYIVALCEVTGADIASLSDAVKRKQGAVAKRLRSAGMLPGDVANCAQWLASQSWRTHGIDLFTIEKERSAWEMAGKPSRAKAVTDAERYRGVPA